MVYMPNEGSKETLRTNVHFDCLILIRQRSHWFFLVKMGEICCGSSPLPWDKCVPSLIFFCLAIKNQATGHYILNGKGEEAKSRTFIDLGVEWDYNIEDDIETLHTDGPLHDPVIVLVRAMQHCIYLTYLKTCSVKIYD